MVPKKFDFEESLHVCKKLSGNVISYNNKTDFDTFVSFLSLSRNMKSPDCVETVKNAYKIMTWGGGTDEVSEGDWRTWNTQKQIKVNII